MKRSCKEVLNVNARELIRPAIVYPLKRGGKKILSQAWDSSPDGECAGINSAFTVYRLRFSDICRDRTLFCSYINRGEVISPLRRIRLFLKGFD